MSNAGGSWGVARHPGTYIITLLRETLSAMQHPRCDFGCKRGQLLSLLSGATSSRMPSATAGRPQPAATTSHATPGKTGFTCGARDQRGITCAAPNRRRGTHRRDLRLPCRRRSYDAPTGLCPGFHPHEHPGMKILCRTGVAMGGSWAPMGSSYDEQDAMLFDNLLVGACLLYDASPILLRYQRGQFYGWRTVPHP